MNGLHKYLVTLVFLSIFSRTECCSCIISHIQTIYCDSEFVIIAKPRAVTNNNFEISYNITLKTIIKASKLGEEALENGKIYTLETSCGVLLDLKKSFILGGRIKDHKPYIDSCGIVVRKSDATQQQIDGFNSVYAEGCNDCEVSLCPSGTCPQSVNQCLWNPSNSEQNKQACLPQTGDSRTICKWTYIYNEVNSSSSKKSSEVEKYV